MSQCRVGVYIASEDRVENVCDVLCTVCNVCLNSVVLMC